MEDSATLTHLGVEDREYESESVACRASDCRRRNDNLAELNQALSSDTVAQEREDPPARPI